MEDIVDVRLAINIVPVQHLLDDLGVDGILSADRHTIWVDQYCYDRDSVRYRFTLAHELGHWYLHEHLHNAAEFDDMDQWKDWIQRMTERDRSFYEFQAYAFAGLILVPPYHLPTLVEESVTWGKSNDFELDFSLEQHVSAAARYIGRRFNVSEDVVRRRGRYDDFWECS